MTQQFTSLSVVSADFLERFLSQFVSRTRTSWLLLLSLVVGDDLEEASVAHVASVIPWRLILTAVMAIVVFVSTARTPLTLVSLGAHQKYRLPLILDLRL